jgi:hypothetical protein
MREVLTEQRRAGVTFPDAWRAGFALVIDPLREPLRAEWGTALYNTKASWRAAYLGLDPPRFPLWSPDDDDQITVHTTHRDRLIA